MEHSLWYFKVLYCL